MNIETIAKTIQKQIGTDAWLAVSARNSTFCEVPGGVQLRFRYGSAHGLAQWCEITYNQGRDDYTVCAYKINRKWERVELDYGGRAANFEGIYFDNLGWLLRDINSEAA